MAVELQNLNFVNKILALKSMMRGDLFYHKTQLLSNRLHLKGNNKTKNIRMGKLNLFGFIILCILFTGCTKDDGDREKILEMTIYPETGYGASVMSDIWTQPLIFSDNDENQKEMLVDIITEGISFDYERGYEYKFRVKKVWMQDPPQDVSSIKYVYIELLSEKKMITEDSEENIELFVSSKTVKFTPKYPCEYEGDGSLPKIYNALRVKKVGTDSWIALTGIEGFDFEEGYEYVLNVKKMTQAEPYSVKYILLNIKSKIKKNEE
jgi:hypothetical protein